MEEIIKRTLKPRKRNLRGFPKKPHTTLFVVRDRQLWYALNDDVKLGPFLSALEAGKAAREFIIKNA